MPLLLEVITEELSVDQVAVVAHRQRAVSTLDPHRLGVLLTAGTGGRVACVADRYVPWEISEVVLLEHLRDEPHSAVEMNSVPISRRDASALLAAVLQGIDAVEGNAGYVFIRRVDAEDAAFLSPGLRLLAMH